MDSLALLTGLLDHYSPTGDETAAVAYLTSRMQELGFDASIDPAGNAVGVLGDGPREIMLLGHIDTVPGQIPVREEDGLLYGRGSVDAKGSLACFVAAAAQAGARPGWRLRVVGAVGEEGDSRGAHYLAANTQPADMLFIGEPSGWQRLTLGYKGNAWLSYTVSQAVSHTASRGQSACEKAVAFWNGLASLAATYNTPHERAFDQVSPSLREMDSSSDGFIETACLNVGVRLPLHLTPESFLEQTAALVDGGRLTVLDSMPAYLAEKNTSLVRAMLAAIRAQGGAPAFSLKTGTSDMNILGPLWKCPLAAYGPGDSALDHTPNEHIQVSEYHNAISILADALEMIQK